MILFALQFPSQHHPRYPDRHFDSCTLNIASITVLFNRISQATADSNHCIFYAAKCRWFAGFQHAAVQTALSEKGRTYDYKRVTQGMKERIFELTPTKPLTPMIFIQEISHYAIENLSPDTTMAAQYQSFLSKPDRRRFIITSPSSS